MNVPEAREGFTASWMALERRALAELRAESARLEQIVRDAFEIPGAGCRAVALSPPSPWRGRAIVVLHEWPPQRLFRDLLRGPQRRCYCGESKR